MIFIKACFWRWEGRGDGPVRWIGRKGYSSLIIGTKGTARATLTNYGTFSLDFKPLELSQQVNGTNLLICRCVKQLRRCMFPAAHSRQGHLPPIKV